MEPTGGGAMVEEGLTNPGGPTDGGGAVGGGARGGVGEPMSQGDGEGPEHQGGAGGREEPDRAPEG